MISRTRVAKSQLSRELSQRYRPNSAKERLSGNEIIQKFNSKKEKRDLFKYDLERGIVNVKSVKFPPYVETESIPATSATCDYINTGFENNCDYISKLYLLGPFIILENYEVYPEGSFSDPDSSLTLFDNFLYTEDYESISDSSTEELGTFTLFINGDGPIVSD